MDIDKGVIEDGTRCRCCGCWIKPDYVYCIPCARKRIKIVNDCLGAGMSIPDAERVADKAYPPKVFQ
jgi:hypothetical protein